MRYSPFLSCRDASVLITAQLDRELTIVERAALTVHLAICDACPRVVAQLDAIRAGMRSWRDAEEDAEPRDRA